MAGVYLQVHRHQPVPLPTNTWTTVPKDMGTMCGYRGTDPSWVYPRVYSSIISISTTIIYVHSSLYIYSSIVVSTSLPLSCWHHSHCCCHCRCCLAVALAMQVASMSMLHCGHLIIIIIVRSWPPHHCHHLAIVSELPCCCCCLAVALAMRVMSTSSCHRWVTATSMSSLWLSCQGCLVIIIVIVSLWYWPCKSCLVF